eukprot:scpid62371/ scgid9293/ 
MASSPPRSATNTTVSQPSSPPAVSPKPAVQGKWRTLAQNGMPPMQLLQIPRQLERPDVRFLDESLPSYGTLAQRPVLPAVAIQESQKVKYSKHLEEQHGEALHSQDWKPLVAPAPTAASAFDVIVEETGRREKRLQGDQGAHMNIFENMKCAKPGNPEGCLCDSHAALQYMRRQQGDIHAGKLQQVDASAATGTGAADAPPRSQNETPWYKLWKMRALGKQEKNEELCESPPPDGYRQVYLPALRPHTSAKNTKTMSVKADSAASGERQENQSRRSSPRQTSEHLQDEQSRRESPRQTSGDLQDDHSRRTNPRQTSADVQDGPSNSTNPMETSGDLSLRKATPQSRRSCAATSKSKPSTVNSDKAESTQDATGAEQPGADQMGTKEDEQQTEDTLDNLL